MFPLKLCGLEKLKGLAGRYYKNLPQNMKSIFEEYKLKLMVYTGDISVTPEELEFVKRDLFKRYNYGLTALKKCEVERAKYIYDPLTQKLEDKLKDNKEFYSQCAEVLLPSAKREIEDREKINLLLIAIREMIIMPYIPVIGEKSVKVGANVYDKYYKTFITTLTDKEKTEKVNEFEKIFKKIYEIKAKLKNSNNGLQDDILFFKSVYWMFAILYKVQSEEFYKFNINQFCHYAENGGQKFFNDYKYTIPSDIERRHAYMKKYINEELNLYIDDYLNSIKENKKKVVYKKEEKSIDNENWKGIGATKQVITIRDTLKISEIIKLMKQNRFIIRPEFQRTEVKNRKKASKIIESILLGVKLPPIYVYVSRKEDGLNRYEVLDGQQRLISILNYMGEKITDENYDYIETSKQKYALCGLNDLSGLNKLVYEDGEKEGLNPFKKEIIQNCEIDVIKIDQQANPNFDSVDMFLRLNQNPCPISINSFEMWNSFDIVKSIEKIKEIAKYKLLRQYGNRMSEEEIVTTLAYMHLQDITIANMNEFFKMFIGIENKEKPDEHNKVKISIRRKDKITDYLENIEKDSPEEEQLLNSINEVSDFIDKLKVLSGENEKILIQIFNPDIKVPRKADRNDIYIMWVILQKLDEHIIKTYRKEILKDLEEVFKLMKYMPDNKGVDSFIDYIKNIINKYSK